MYTRNYKMVKMALLMILFANMAVAVVKLALGEHCSSQSIIADGIHSVADGASNIVGLIGISLASKPRDKKHPYGHGKYEIVASLFIGGILLLMAVRILYHAIGSFRNPVIPHFHRHEILMMVAAIGINTVVAFIEFRLGKQLDSVILITDSLHTRSDILISCTVLLGLWAIHSGFPVWVDGVMSIAVAVVILTSGWRIISSCIDILVDSTAVDSGEIQRIVSTIPTVYDVHHIRSRGRMPYLFIDLHIMVDPLQSVQEAHRLSHEIEANLRRHYGEYTEVSIHIEPRDDIDGADVSD